MSKPGPRITVGIPQWQVKSYLLPCLRSIRKHSAKYDLEVIVVDNGSQDDSLDYLRSLDWIRLIERPEETRDNWPSNFFTGLDCASRAARGEFFVGMHTDVFVKSDHWLDPFLREMMRDPQVGATGAWKLELSNSFYQFQKRVLGYANYRIKRFFGGRKRHVFWKQGTYPRDYLAMYRRQALLDHEITFDSVNGWIGGGLSVSNQLLAADYRMGMFPVREMAQHVVHVAHGTAAVTPWRPLNHARSQQKAEARVAKLFDEPWVKSLIQDDSLDGNRRAAA
jgi:glycosyltransferase involved in cell wall biosynthesis